MNWKELEKIVEENKRENTYVEAMELGGVILPLVKIKEYNLFLLGMGENFDSILLYLKSNDINVKGIICQDKKTMDFYLGIPIVTFDEIGGQVAEKVFVIVTDAELFYDDKYIFYSKVYKFAKRIYDVIKIRPLMRRHNINKKRTDVIKALESHGIHNYYFLKQTDYRNVCAFESVYYCNRMHYYKTHFKELEQTYEMLCDETSKKTMIEYIRVFLQSGLYRLEECDGRNKYFAGYGRGKDMEHLYKHKEDEVWINCGASVGDNILLYLAEGYKAKKIYAFEGSKVVYDSLCKNINLLPEKMKSIISPVNLYISTNTNWDYIIQEKITLINADVEGAELELLRTIKNKIKSDRPVLAICVYHHNEDLVEIPRLINETVEGYRYLLRKYPCAIGNPLRTSELVLYAIPEERLNATKAYQL